MKSLLEKFAERTLPKRISLLFWVIFSLLLCICDYMFDVGAEIISIIPEDTYVLLEKISHIVFIFLPSSSVILFTIALILYLVSILFEHLEDKQILYNSYHQKIRVLSYHPKEWGFNVVKMALITFLISSVLDFKNICTFIQTQNFSSSEIVIFIALTALACIADEFKYIY